MKKESKQPIILWIVISTLIIAILWLLFTEPDPPSTRIEVRAEENRETKARIDARDTLIARLYERLHEDSLSAERAANGFKTQISRLQEKLRKNDLSKASAPELDSIVNERYPTQSGISYCMPITAARAMFQDAINSQIKDSIILVDSARIVQLEDEKADDAKKYKSIIWNLESNNLDQERISSNLSMDVDDLMRENKKLRRKERARKVVKWIERGGIAVASFFIGKGIR
jgi:hypothetical protein